MRMLMVIVCYFLFLSQLIASAYGLECYFCNTTMENDACGQGLPNISTTNCISGEDCAVYQYDVFLNNQKIGTGTSRGCEKKKNYCGIAEDMINILVKPGMVKEKNCYKCEKDLCNSSSDTNVPYFLFVTILLIDMNVF